MANVKKLIGYTTTGKTVYGIIERQLDSYLLNDADGAFATAPADPYISFTEHSVLKGEYILSESRTVWNNGLYKSTVYEQAGGSPVPASDLVVAFQYMYILSDLEVVNDADVGAILVDTAVIGALGAGLTALSTQASVNAIKAKTDYLPSGIAKGIALSNFPVFMVLASDSVTAATGKTVVCTISKDGAAFVSSTNAVTEIGNGAYKINLTAAELNYDVVILRFANIDCNDRAIAINTS